MDYLNEILKPSQKAKIIGEIYCITNSITNKRYVGQAVSHRMNKGKYRPFGYIGRFNDHISEAVNNTKKKQCTLLNNSIRKYGKDAFQVKLIKRCRVDELDKFEENYIKEFDSMFPNGYNLTKGGKCGSYVMVKNNQPIKKPKTKRGREYGYVHKESTKHKMACRMKQISIDQNRECKMRTTMNSYYDKQKIDILSEYDLDDDVQSYIKPVYKKNTKLLHNYMIRINGRKLTLRGDDQSLDKKYDRLLNILLKAKKISDSKNS